MYEEKWYIKVSAWLKPICILFSAYTRVFKYQPWTLFLLIQSKLYRRRREHLCEITGGTLWPRSSSSTFHFRYYMKKANSSVYKLEIWNIQGVPRNMTVERRLEYRLWSWSLSKSNEKIYISGNFESTKKTDHILECKG